MNIRFLLAHSTALARVFFFLTGILISAYALADAAEPAVLRGQVSLEAYQNALRASSAEAVHKGAGQGQATMTGESASVSAGASYDSAKTSVKDFGPAKVARTDRSSLPKARYADAVPRPEGLSRPVKNALLYGLGGLAAGALLGGLIGLAVVGSVTAAPVVAGAAVGMLAGAAIGALVGLGYDAVESIIW